MVGSPRFATSSAVGRLAHGASRGPRGVSLLFKLWSPIYDAPIFQRTYYRRVHARLRAALDGLEPRRVVDLGCGTGQLTDDLHRRWPRALVTGVDLSSEMLAAAQRRLGVGSIPFVRAD